VLREEEDDATRFFEGPTPLYWTRREAASSSSCHYYGRNAEDTLAVVRMVERLSGSELDIEGLAVGEALAIRIPVRWRDAGQFMREAETGLQAAIDQWERWLDDVVAGARASPERRAARASPFALRADDQRVLKVPPLPALAIPTRSPADETPAQR